MNTKQLDSQYARALQRAEQWGQGHLLAFFAELDEPRRQALLDDILGIDFELVCGLYEGAAHAGTPPAADIRPAAATDKRALSTAAIAEAEALGLSEMHAGRYAVVTMAGGQGTRLGHAGPKGTFTVRLNRDMTLFEVQAERIREMSERAGADIPWYIMTSAENHDATQAFFETNRNYGLSTVCFFRQGALPMVGLDGRILLEEKHRVRQGPDGNGTLFMTMAASGVADDMRRRGVRWFYAGNIDNILARVADPLAVGIALQQGVRCLSKSVLKRDPGEKAGVFCLKDGRPAVVEYTEISPEMAAQTDGAGNYVYGDAHISCSLFHTDIFDFKGIHAMPYHTAVKKSPFIAGDGSLITPDAPNAYKFEAFIFDAFQLFDRITVLRVDREAEFAPVKNASGEDSPATARELYIKAFGK